MMALKRRLIRVGAIALVASIAAWLGVSFFVAHRLTHRSRPKYDEPTPAGMESVRLTARDGLGLGAWYLPGKEEGLSVLLLHGNNGSRRNSLERAKLLAKDGHAILMITERAHGDSDGDRNDIGWSARLDAIAAVEYLEKARPGKAVVIHGTSMGGAAAIFAAGELGERVGGYMLESVYADLKTATWNRMDLYLPGPFNLLAYGGVRIAGWFLLPELDRIAPAERAGDIPRGTPVLVIAGGLDRHARPEESVAIANRIGPRARLEVFEKAEHRGLPESAPALYEALLRGFCEGVRTAGSRPTASPGADAREGPGSPGAVPLPSVAGSVIMETVSCERLAVASPRSGAPALANWVNPGAPGGVGR